MDLSFTLAVSMCVSLEGFMIDEFYIGWFYETP